MSSKSPRDDSYNFEMRLNAVQYLVLAMFIALGIRFYALQVTRHEEYRVRAENNRIRQIPIPAPRGAILDRYGRLLVDNRPAYNVFLTPEDIASRDETITALADNFGVDRNQLVEELNDPKRPKSQPILVKQNASDADRAWIAAHEFEHPEITLEMQPQRNYPHAKLASHVLGYIGEISSRQLEMDRYKEKYKAGDIIGLGGIEAVYDEVLRGVDGVRSVVVDSRGRPLGVMEKREPIKGHDIVTTIDLDLQRVAEEEFYAKKDTGALVAMDPRN